MRGRLGMKASAGIGVVRSRRSDGSSGEPGVRQVRNGRHQEGPRVAGGFRVEEGFRPTVTAD